MPVRPVVAPLLAVILSLAAAPSALAAPKVRTHPAVKGDPECVTCHRAKTPQAFQDWERSPHGATLVMCVVCHGSVGADFRARPAAAGCQGCHAVQVATLAKRSLKDCFACHAPHALTPNPHR
jgi:hypothetical protein